MASSTRPRTWKPLVGLAGASIVGVLVLALVDDVLVARTLAIAVLCLALWLLEIVPAFVPTLVLLAAGPLWLSGLAPAYTLPSMLKAAADPVMALFFGGFVIAQAARRHGLDGVAARAVIRAARGDRRRLIVFLALTSAVLSMWMSNIAAAALLIQVVAPLVESEPRESTFRRATFLAIAFGANFGGMATPIGSGPNAIAIAAIPAGVTFIDWMLFALPLTLGMVGAACIIIIVALRVSGSFAATLEATRVASAPRQMRAVSLILAACIAGWLTEPLHGVGAPIVALVAAVALFAFSLVGERELKDIDWSTLLLIAGGILLGRMLEASGVLALVAAQSNIDASLRLGLFVFGASFLSALMSNTATATLLIPMAMAVPASPSTAILIAIGCSLGAPFSISTPPNAMVVGRGVLAKDLLVVGLPLMILGCVAVSLTGPFVLGVFGLAR